MILKYLVILLTLSMCIFARNITNTNHDIHTLTQDKGDLEISLANLQMNNTVDILKIKESELGSSSISTIGDLKGVETKIKFGLTKNFQLSYTNSVQEISFIGNNLFNKRDDIFLRYNLFKNDYAHFNSGLSLDVGYTRNRLNPFAINEKITTITQTTTNPNALTTKKESSISLNTSKTNLLSRVSSVNYSVNVQEFTYDASLNTANSTTIDILNDSNPAYTTTNATERQQISNIINTVSSNAQNGTDILLNDFKDDSYYVRLLTGFYTKTSLYDFYIGYKRTKISGNITTDETTKSLLDLVNKYFSNTNIPSLPIDLSREEKMLFVGFNITSDWKYAIMEFGYEYERILRDSQLSYVNFNHIINITLSKPITKNFLLFAGAKIMYRQFNGQIPYLYNEYFQSTFDHKYGYARFGLQYRFEL